MNCGPTFHRWHRSTSGRTTRWFVRSALLAGVVFVLSVTGCVREGAEVPPGVLVVSTEQTASWVRSFNPVSAAAAARWPTLAGIYEPLYVFNSIQAEQVPWLAVHHEWKDDNRRVRLTTRSGVFWSDGVPFSSEDVAFTFHLLRDHASLDRRGLWAFLDDVSVVDSVTVDFHFQRVYVPGFDEVVAQQIIPRHIWEEVEDPVMFPNENPVGTGPFTEVRYFRDQVWELGRNPNYWQPGKPYIDALRFPAYTSNDRANTALVFGEVDWAGNFIPAVDRVFVGRDPESHDYWFPLTGSTVFLYANTQRAPFDDVRVRKAFSMGIDRELLVDVAAFRYSRPSDATALSDAYASWRDPEVADDSWVKFDLAEANRLLDEVGLVRGEDGFRRKTDGSRLDYQIITVSGWSDWVRAGQVIARGMTEIGVEASVKTYEFGAWFERVQKGDFDLSLGWSFEGPTPYSFYRWLMSNETVQPAGELARGNWHRFGAEAADRSLAAFEREADPERKRELARDLQRVFSETAPAIPLYPNPSWAEFNTGRFEGFPTAENPYADPSPNKFDRGEILLVLTSLVPRSGD